ncbi:oxidoreductase molybdopterin binding protein [Natronococcus amylolyticus DSM 10524]|uniref:Oxidoreductase molybdopterin binding protein n=1 Tax=Natronococcus amylolyticus DSM 10524 TaxID=1227497 RepID=L9XDK5_9EURY|nr:sulfite oxidase [Natronococcus amylolyticus]ELY59804.1 oxidoreductase molybdopterin binding protein [Natronococcus amylolyticus DSM 10524]
MGTEERRASRHDEIKAILERKGGAEEARDDADKYTVVGAANRKTYANWLTPIEEHFVCHRNDMPEADGDGEWTVSLTGYLEDAHSVAEIREEFPTVAVAHTMECAGNGRGQHRPETGSVQWGYEAAGTAVWSGTPLSAVLRGELEDVPDDAWLTAVGGDPSDGEDVFARSIPLSKAVDDCILAYEMNGQMLPREHGFPIRLIVPGWYGVNSVKWLDELRVMDEMVTDESLDRPGDHAYWQQEAYRIHPEGVEPAVNETVETGDTWDQLEGGEPAHPYTFDQTVMSVIGEPDGESAVTVPEDGTVEITGVAWAGDDDVAGVEVSTDGGDSWAEAELFGPDYAGAWRLFQYDWEATPGEYVLASRATDDRGRRQPMRISNPDAWRDALDDDEFPWNEGGYAANAVLPNALELEVRSP